MEYQSFLMETFSFFKQITLSLLFHYYEKKSNENLMENQKSVRIP